MVTNPVIQTEHAVIYSGNNLEILPTLPDNSVDAIVTDPPYELGFMGKSWDNTGIAYSVELWRECLRVLKPGGHLLAFGGTRTWHRLAVAIEDAGFEIRDNIAWLYGSGFPKSHNISKAIDKAAGAEREIIDTIADRWAGKGNVYARATETNNESINITVPTTDEAKKWDGWGTALKPAHEPIVVARKPLIGTVAENVLQYGVGGLNINASRIGTEVRENPQAGFIRRGRTHEEVWHGVDKNRPKGTVTVDGRWPANIILDEYTAALLDEQSGNRPGGQFPSRRGQAVNTSFASGQETVGGARSMGDSGGASRFFYIAKANKRDRNEGLDGLPKQSNSNYGSIQERSSNPVKQNYHPTVKPTSLMRYLVRLVTPPNGIVLDPFTGSGSTGKAAILENKHFIGIELTADYLPIIAGRLEHAEQTLSTKADDLFA